MRKRKVLVSPIMFFALLACDREPDSEGNRQIFVRNNTDLNLFFTYTQGFADSKKMVRENAPAHSSNLCRMIGGIQVEYGYDRISLTDEQCDLTSCVILIDSAAIGILRSSSNPSVIPK